MDSVWGSPGVCGSYRWDGWVGVLSARLAGSFVLIVSLLVARIDSLKGFEADRLPFSFVASFSSTGPPSPLHRRLHSQQSSSNPTPQLSRHRISIVSAIPPPYHPHRPTPSSSPLRRVPPSSSSPPSELSASLQASRETEQQESVGEVSRRVAFGTRDGRERASSTRRAEASDWIPSTARRGRRRWSSGRREVLWSNSNLR